MFERGFRTRRDEVLEDGRLLTWNLQAHFVHLREETGTEESVRGFVQMKWELTLVPGAHPQLESSADDNGEQYALVGRGYGFRCRRHDLKCSDYAFIPHDWQAEAESLMHTISPPAQRTGRMERTPHHSPFKLS